MALDRIRAIANPVVPKEGERYYGTVVKTADFGAFISLTPGSDGLLHISKLPKPEGKRLNHADEAVEVGQKFWVEVAEVKDGRKFSLSLVEGPQGTPSRGPQAGPRPAGRPETREPRSEASPADRGREGPGERRERRRERVDGDAGERRERMRDRSAAPGNAAEVADADDRDGEEAEGRRRRRRRR
jgi:polyribonucleotide nucleotidyltransferase